MLWLRPLAAIPLLGILAAEADGLGSLRLLLSRGRSQSVHQKRKMSS